MQYQLASSRQVRVNQSSSLRRDVLWNVSEPGDPYDIKKSMIAKLPGDRKIFMGDHLELVCLLQAAEIERLCQFLDDYKLKFREIERNNLDRHSYEIQIKQLTEKVSNEESLRIEISKHKQFSKKLQTEIESLQRNSRDNYQQDQGYKLNYEKSLERINQLNNQNKNLKLQISEYSFQIQNFNARFEALEKAKNREIEDLKTNFNQFSRESYEGSISSIRNQSQAEAKRFEYEIKRLKEIIETKNLQINETQKKLESLSNELTFLKNKGDSNYSMERQLVEYESRFVIFGQEIQRLNTTLGDHISRLEQSELKRRELARAVERLQYENRQLDAKLRLKDTEISHLNDIIKSRENQPKKTNENQQILADYQFKISSLTRDNQMLNAKLKLQLENIKRYREEIQKLSFENSRYKLLERQNSTLKDGAIQITNLRKRVAELQNKSSILNQQLERLNYSLKGKDSELQKYKNASYENQSLKAKTKQLEYTLSRKYQIEITRITAEYEQRIESISRSKGSQLQFKVENYQREFDRLKELLKNKSEQSDKQRSRIYQLETLISRSELQSSTKLKNYQLSISSLKRENEELFNKSKLLNENDKRLYQLQSKISQYDRDLERTNSTVKAREEEIINLKSKLRQSEGINQKYEIDTSRFKIGVQQNINVIRSENQQLKRRLAELVNESNRKLLQASQQIERLGANLKTKMEEKAILQNKFRQLTQQSEFLKQNVQKLTGQNEELRRRLIENEAKINSLYNDSNNNLKNLSQQNQFLKKQLKDIQDKATKSLGGYEQNLGSLSKENQDLKRKLAEYESRLALLSQQFERLSQQLKSRLNDYNILNEEYESAKKKFKQYENEVNNQFEGEIKRRFNQYQQTIRNASLENEELKRRLADLQSKSTRINTEYEKIANLLKQSNLENQALRKQLGMRETLVSNYQIEFKNKINLYENNVLNLTKINEELQRKLSETDNYAKQKSDDSVRLQNSLRQLGLENENIKRQFKQYQYSVNQKLQGEIQRKINSLQEANNKLIQQNEELRKRIMELGGDYGNKLASSQNRYVILSQENQRVKQNLTAYASQNDFLKKKLEGLETSISNYEGEVKRRFTGFEQNITAINKENEELRRRLQQLGDLNRKLTDYQSKIAFLSQELERVTANLKALAQQNEQLKRQLNQKHLQTSNYELQYSRKVTTYQTNLTYLQKENEDIKKRLAEYEQRILSLSQQLERVNNNYKSKAEQSTRLEMTLKSYDMEATRKLSNYDQNFTLLSKQNEDLKRKLLQYGDLNRRSQQLQNRLALASQQLERLTLNLKTKQDQNIKLDTVARNQANELQSWKRKYSELEGNFAKTYEFQIKTKYTSYEQTINELNRRNTENEAKVFNATQQIQRLNNILRLKVQESTQLNASYKNLTSQYDDLKRRVRDTENNFSQNSTSMKRQNDQLRRKLQQYELKFTQYSQQNEKRIAQYENKLKIMGQEIERLNQTLRSRTDELELIKRQFKQYELSVSNKFDGEIKTKFYQYQTTIATKNKQNEQLRRKIQELGEQSKRANDYENKLVLASQQLERLNMLLSSKKEELLKISKENDELRRKLNEYNEINRKIPQYQNKMALFVQENQKLQFALRNKTDELSMLDNKSRQALQENQNLKRQIKDLEYSWSSKYETEINKKVVGYEQNITILNREKEDLGRKKQDYEARLALLGQELERVNGLLKSKSQENAKLTTELDNIKKAAQQKIQSSESEFVTLQNNYTLISKEYDNSKRHLQEYQLSIRKLYTEFQRLQGIINELKKQKQSLFEKNHNLSTEINRLALENKDLEEQTQQVRLRLSDESALQKRINQHLALMVILFAEIETLRMRVKDKQKEVAQVRRSSLAPNIL